MWGDIAIAFILAFVVTLMATPYTMKIANKIGAIDVPKDERRAHKKAIPRFGRTSSNIRIFSSNNIFIDSNEYGTHNKYIWI